MVDVDTSYEYHYVILTLYFSKHQTSNVAQIHLGFVFFILFFSLKTMLLFLEEFTL